MNAKILLAVAALVAAPFPLHAAEIGDAAAPIEISDWVKGEAFTLDEVKGEKIVVVEFWATWCGPCVKSIPHLSELQAKYADRGVVFLGVTNEDAKTAGEFVNKMGSQMDYVVACDKNGATNKAYLDAFGVKGIPHAFIVGRDGKIAWHGHPMKGLDEMLEQLASAVVKEDPMAAKRALGRAKLAEFVQLASTGNSEARLDALAVELAALEKETGGIEPGKPLDLVAVRRDSRFQSLLRDYQRAVAAGKPAEELSKLEKAAAPFAPAGFKFGGYAGQFNLQRVFQEYYRVVTAATPDEARVNELAARLRSIESDDVDAQNEVAWTMLTDESVKIRDAALALKFAHAAFVLSHGKNTDVLETYGMALFQNGKNAEAVKIIEQAISLETDAGRKEELGGTLKTYQEKR